MKFALSAFFIKKSQKIINSLDLWLYFLFFVGENVIC